MAEDSPLTVTQQGIHLVVRNGWTGYNCSAKNMIQICFREKVTDVQNYKLHNLDNYKLHNLDNYKLHNLDNYTCKLHNLDTILKFWMQ